MEITGIMLFIIPFTAVLIPVLIFLSSYILGAIGTSQILKRRGYKKSWIAFIPVLNSYSLGYIADDINKQKNLKTHNRIWLFVLRGICAIVILSLLIFLFSYVFSAIIQRGEIHTAYISAMLIQLMPLFLIFSLISFVFECICNYKIFVDYSYKNAVLMTILSVLLMIAPYFVFAIRKNPSATLQEKNLNNSII